jgi:hypothetical protein
MKPIILVELAIWAFLLLNLLNCNESFNLFGRYKSESYKFGIFLFKKFMQLDKSTILLAF